jgi:hypothetical protein
VALLSTATAQFSLTVNAPLVSKEEAAGSALLTVEVSASSIPEALVRSITEGNAPFDICGAFMWDGRPAEFKRGTLHTVGCIQEKIRRP